MAAQPALQPTQMVVHSTRDGILSYHKWYSVLPQTVVYNSDYLLVYLTQSGIVSKCRLTTSLESR